MARREDIGPGATARLSTNLEAGHHTLICIEPGTTGAGCTSTSP